MHRPLSVPCESRAQVVTPLVAYQRPLVHGIVHHINLYIARLSESEFVTHIFTTRPSGLET